MSHTRMLSPCLLCWPPMVGRQRNTGHCIPSARLPQCTARPFGPHVTIQTQDIRQTMALKTDLFDWPVGRKCDAFETPSSVVPVARRCHNGLKHWGKINMVPSVPSFHHHVIVVSFVQRLCSLGDLSIHICLCPSSP